MTEQESFLDKILSHSKHAAIAVLTTICPMANGVWQYMSAIETENLIKLVNGINERVEGLEKSDVIDFRERGSSEDGEGLLKYSFIKAAKCHRKEQIEKMVDIIIAALAKKAINYNDAEVLIDIVCDLNDEEAVFLFQIYEEFKSVNSDESPLRQSGFINFAFEDPFFNVENDFNIKSFSLYSRLIAKGLLEEINQTRTIWDGEKNIKHRVFRFTYYGSLFLKIIYGYIL